jgi:hypothetical protein
LSLAISIYLIRQSLRCRFYDWDALKAFPVIDIRNTLPGLQHDFCLLWNEVVQEARIPRNHKRYSPPVRILRWTYRHYIALHRDTDAVPTTFFPSTNPFDSTLPIPSSYPLCTLPSHLDACPPDPDLYTVPSQPGGSSSPDGLTRQPTPGGSAVSQRAEGNSTAGPLSQQFDLTTTRETAQALAAIPPTFSSNSGSRVTLASSQNQTIPMEDLRHQIRSQRIVPSLFGILMNSLKHDGSTDVID